MTNHSTQRIFEILSDKGFLDEIYWDGAECLWFTEDYPTDPEHCHLVIQDFVSMKTIRLIDAYVDIRGIEFNDLDNSGIRFLVREKVE